MREFVPPLRTILDRMDDEERTDCEEGMDCEERMDHEKGERGGQEGDATPTMDGEDGKDSEEVDCEEKVNCEEEADREEADCEHRGWTAWMARRDLILRSDVPCLYGGDVSCSNIHQD